MVFRTACTVAFTLGHTLSPVSAKMDGASTMLRSKLPRLLGFDEAADTVQTVYSEDAQAWRMLGVYMDCEGQDDGSSVCQRYILWAAYIDEEYTGNGQGEYMFYDSETGKWDDSACELAGSERCVKMDCHLPNTHFKLLGYYKQYGVYDFFEQLFDHQGSCTWSQSEYYFMEGSREAWPQGCTQSAVADDNGAYAYYDIKPLTGGRMTIGLYSDDMCTVAYTGSLTVEEVIQVDDEEDNYGDDGNQYVSDIGSQEWVEKWNKGLEVYKTCQPCKVSTLSNSARRRRLEEDAAEDGGDAGEDQGDNAQDDDGLFTCQDAAGYQGANQCALFAMNTDIQPATFRDVRLASLQGTIVRANASGATSSPMQKWWRAWGFFTLSSLVFFIGIIMFCCFVKVKRRTFSSSANEPLLSSSKSNNSTTTNKSSSKSSKSNSRK